MTDIVKKVMGSNPDGTVIDWKTLCQPNSKWVTFQNQRKMRQQKEREGLQLFYAVPKIQWPPSPIVLIATRLWVTFSYF